MLFVAEKLTALDVVKNRLEAARLGEFILPLQAGRGTRDKVYQSLDDRLSIEQANQRAYRDFNSQQSALERRRQVLQDYLDALSADFGTSGYSVYDVIGYGIATNEDRDGTPKEVRRISVPDCENLGAVNIEAIVSDAEEFAERLGRINRMPALWLDAGAAILNRDDAEDACESLANLADRIETFTARVSNSDAAPLITEGPFAVNFSGLVKLLHEIDTKGGEIDAEMVERLTDETSRWSVRDFCSQIQERRTLTAQLGRHLTDPEAWGLLDQIHSARTFAAAQDNAIDPLAHRDRIENLKIKQGELRQQRILVAALPANWASRTQKPLSEIHTQALLLMRSPDHAISFRQADPEQLSGSRSESMKKFANALSENLGRIRQGIPNAGKHDEQAMRRAASAISDAGIFRFMSGEYKDARDTYVNILKGSSKDDREAMSQRLRTYADWLGKERSFAATHEFKQSFGDFFSSLSTDMSKIDDIVALHQLCYEISGGDADLCRGLEADDLSAVEAFVDYKDWTGLSFDELKGEIEAVERKLTEEISLEKEAQANLDIFTGSAVVSLDVIDTLLERNDRKQEITFLIEQSVAADVLGDRYTGTGTSTEALTVECAIAEMIAGTSEPDFFLSTLKTGNAGSLLGEVSALADERTSIDAETTEIGRILQLDDDVAVTAALSDRLADLRAAATDPSSLMKWARLRKSEETLREQGFDKLVDWVLSEGDNFDPARLAPIVRAIIAKSMVDKAYQIHGSSLQGYDGENFDRIRAEIVKKDRDLIEMSRDVVRNLLIGSAKPPVGNGIGRKSTYTDMSLIRNEMGKKRNRIGVRELTRRAGSALLELKPCWMMSPLAVANYLHDGMTFDLVVIDEASQMTPENAIGALSRARQAVVVGDTKQLPPTSFFQKILDDSDVDDDLREDSESVLDMANMAFRPVRQLRWHYRSRHSALIQFSNKWMYDDKLTIFPSAREDDPEFGVHLEEIAGIYKGRMNEFEARAVVRAVVAHMRDTPDLSLGVCTMNSDQKELIGSNPTKVPKVSQQFL